MHFDIASEAIRDGALLYVASGGYAPLDIERVSILDVHVLRTNGQCELVFSFPEDVHYFIFGNAGIDVYGKFAYLRRMHDYYADASYAGDE